MSLFRVLVFGSFITVVFSAYGCSAGTAETEGQAAPDLRANLENSTAAAAEAAKEKPKAP